MASIPSPDECLARYRSTGDPTAFGALFDVTGPELLRVAVALCGDASTAEDVLQETFLAALEDLESFDVSRPVMPWLVGILRHRAERARRSAGRRPDPVRINRADDDAGRDPLWALARSDDPRRLRLLEGMEALAEPYRSVALLRWRYGLAPAEIAHVRSEAASTTRSLLSRALQRLRQLTLGLSALLVGMRPSRGLAAVRQEVVAASARTGATVTVAAVGGTLVTKKALSVVGVLVLAAAGGAWWYSSPPASRPEAAILPRAGLEPTGPVLQAPGTVARQASTPVTPDRTASASTVRVRVVAGGVPLAQAHVELRLPSERHLPPRREGVTRPDGTLELELAEAWQEVELSVWAPGHTREVKDAGAGQDVLMRLWAAAGLEGYVRDTLNEEPVANAEIWAKQPGAPWSDRGVPFLVRARSDSEGRYRLNGLPPGRVDVGVVAGDRVAHGLLAVVEVGRVSQRDLFVGRGGRVEGRVTLDGQAAADVEVRAWLNGGTEAQRRLAQTAPDGRFAFDGLSDGEWHVTVHDPLGGDGRAVPARVSTGSTLVRDVALQGTVRVTGRVLLDGLAAPAVEIGTVQRSIGFGGVRTDAAGRFETTEGRARPHLRLHAHLPGVGFRALELKLPGPDAPPLEVTLVRFARIRGRIIGPRGTSPEGSRIQVESSHSEFCNVRVLADGTFEAVVPPGSVGLDATAPGWPAAERVTVELQEGEVLEGIEVPFGDGGDLSGAVVDAGGRPLARARVQVANVSARGGDLTTCLTDDAGRFAFRALPVEAAHLYVTAMGGLLREVKDVHVPQTDARIVMEAEPPPITGHVLRSDGSPCRQGWVLVRLLTDRTGAQRTEPADLLPLRFNDADGRFEGLNNELRDLPGWKALICASDGIAISGWRELDSAARNGVSLRLAGAGGVVGRARDRHGQPLGDVRISCTGLVHERATRSDAQGRFALSPLIAGPQVLTLTREGYCSIRLAHIVDPGREEAIDVVLALGGTVVVRVRDQADQPIEGAQVRFLDAGGRAIPLDEYRNSVNWTPRAAVSRELQTTTDAGGVCTRLFLPPGPVVAEIRREGRASLRVPVNVVDEVEVEAGVVLLPAATPR